MPNVTLMPLTTVLEFKNDHVRIRNKDQETELPLFDAVIFCAGMLPQGEAPQEVTRKAGQQEVVGDAYEVGDIYSAVHAGYELAMKH
jgi:hypothetical protein